MMVSEPRQIEPKKQWRLFISVGVFFKGRLNRGTEFDRSMRNPVAGRGDGHRF
jgi:hypothetical protein